MADGCERAGFGLSPFVVRVYRGEQFLILLLSLSRVDGCLFGSRSITRRARQGIYLLHDLPQFVKREQSAQSQLSLLGVTSCVMCS